MSCYISQLLSLMYLLFIFSFLCLHICLKLKTMVVVKGFSHFYFSHVQHILLHFHLYFFHFLFYIFYSSMIKIIKWKSFFNDLGFLSLFILSYVISSFLFYPRIFYRDLFLSLFILSHFFFYITNLTN